MDLEHTLAEVGPRLKRVRAERGVTLAELSEATGISKSTLSRLESGQRKPSPGLLSNGALASHSKGIAKNASTIAMNAV